MILISYKHIVALVFIMCLHISNTELPNNVVALLKIVGTVGVEEPKAYFDRNQPLIIDPETNKLAWFNVQSLTFDIFGENNYMCYNMRNNSHELTEREVVMREDQVTAIYNVFSGTNNQFKNSPLFLIFNIMRKRDNIKKNNLLEDDKYLSWTRQVQYYRYQLYPEYDDTIISYWQEVESKLINCVEENKNSPLLNTNEKYTNPDLKILQIKYIGTNNVYAKQGEEENLQDYLFRLLKLHHWFKIMKSTKILEGEIAENYQLRIIRLGFIPLRNDELKIFYPDHKLNYSNNTHNRTALNDILYNPSDTENIELFITHIICHCILPVSEYKIPKHMPPRWNKDKHPYQSYYNGLIGESSGSGIQHFQGL